MIQFSNSLFVLVQGSSELDPSRYRSQSEKGQSFQGESGSFRYEAEEQDPDEG